MIYHTDSFSPDIQTPHKQYPIDPDNFIEEIVFDPRLTPAEYTFKLRTLEKLGFNGEKVKLSNLYYFHPEKILLQL